MEPDTLAESPTALEASAEAVHKAKGAAQAVETARELQIAEAVAKTKEETKMAIFEGLKEIFHPADDADPEHMKVIYGKIPILCIRMDAMDKNIATINENIKWGVRIVISAVLVAFVGVAISTVIAFLQK